MTRSVAVGPLEADRSAYVIELQRRIESDQDACIICALTDQLIGNYEEARHQLLWRYKFNILILH
jgi:hypothetical protein